MEEFSVHLFVVNDGREKKWIVLWSEGVERRFGRKDVFKGKKPFAMEFGPKGRIAFPDQRGEDSLFHFGQMFDDRTDSLEIFARFQEDLDDLQEGIGMERIEREKPLIIVLFVAMNEEDQEKRQTEERLEEFDVVEELLSRFEQMVIRFSLLLLPRMFLFFDQQHFLQGRREEFHRQLKISVGEIDQRFLRRTTTTERRQTTVFNVVDRLPFRQQTAKMFYNGQMPQTSRETRRTETGVIADQTSNVGQRIERGRFDQRMELFDQMSRLRDGSEVFLRPRRRRGGSRRGDEELMSSCQRRLFFPMDF